MTSALSRILFFVAIIITAIADCVVMVVPFRALYPLVAVFLHPAGVLCQDVAWGSATVSLSKPSAGNDTVTATSQMPFPNSTLYDGISQPPPALDQNITNVKDNGSWSSFSIQLHPQTMKPTTVSATKVPTPDTPDVTVGAYYYAWHKSHWHMRDSPPSYLRGELDPRQQPRLGEYDDSKPEVIMQHLEWSRRANIQVWFAAWFGPGSSTDQNLRNTILPLLPTSGVRIAILFETKPWYEGVQQTDVFSGTEFLPLQEDSAYLCSNYFDHPSYYRIENRPVVFVYLTRSWERRCALRQVIEHIRQGCPRHNLYIIGDHVWGDGPDNSTDIFSYLDAVANYDIYGNMGRPRYAGLDRVKKYYERAQQWKDVANANGKGLVPGVVPGYNDRGNRIEPDRPAMSRRLTESSPEGSLFESLLQEAIRMVDPVADNLLLVTSFNEWEEDSQIEPTEGGSTIEPLLLTEGLEYRAYGTLYLDLLAQYTHSIPESEEPTTTQSRKPGLEPTQQSTSTPFADLSSIPTDAPTFTSGEAHFGMMAKYTHPPNLRRRFARDQPAPTRDFINLFTGSASRHTSWDRAGVSTAVSSTNPTLIPSEIPISNPTFDPTTATTQYPSSRPIVFPSTDPTEIPTARPTEWPSRPPTPRSTAEIREDPAHHPTLAPANHPTNGPSHKPTLEPKFESEEEHEATWCLIT